MKRPAVFVTDFIATPDVEAGALADMADVVVVGEEDDSKFPETLFGASALLVWHARVTAVTIERLRACRAIVRYGVGYDNVDIEAAGRCGIPVCNNPDYGTEEVADTTVALLLALARGLPHYSEEIREGPRGWDWSATRPLHRLRGRTLGIIGLGRIGTAVALRAKAFGLRVVFHDPYKPDGYDKTLGIERASTLDDLLAAADIVTVHVPLTAETQGMVDAAFLGKMRRGSLLVNTSRGGVLDSLACLEPALRAGQLQGVGLDVLPQEPPPPDDPLIRAWRAKEEWIRHRLVITPHAAFYSEEAFLEMRRKAAAIVRAALLGQPLRNVVNESFLRNRPHEGIASATPSSS